MSNSYKLEKGKTLIQLNSLNLKICSIKSKQLWQNITTKCIAALSQCVVNCDTLIPWYWLLIIHFNCTYLSLISNFARSLPPFPLCPFTRSQMFPWLDNMDWIGPPEMTKVRVCWGQHFAETPGNILKTGEELTETGKESKECDCRMSFCDTLLSGRRPCWPTRMTSQGSKCFAKYFFSGSGQIWNSDLGREMSLADNM